MLSIETEARVAKLFLNLADGEKSVEINRQVLSEQLDFDAYLIFKRLDSQAKNSIDEFDIVDFLKLNSVYCSYNEARFIIFFYDADGDGNLNYSEFLNLILSDNNYTLRRLARDRAGLSTRLSLSYDVEYSLTKLFERELDLVRNLELSLSDIKSRYDFNVYDLYSTFQAYSYLTKEKNGVDVLETDVNSIVKRLDIDRDGRVSFTEFKKFFSFPNYSKDSFLYKSSNLSGSLSRSTLYDTKSSFRRFESPLRSSGSPLKSDSYSANRTIRYASPFRSSYRTQIMTRSPIRSPLRSTVRSPVRNTSFSPNRSLIRSVDVSRSRVNTVENLSKPYSYISLEEETFQNYLKEIITAENEIERSKCDLILRSDFNIEDAFRIFELDERGYINDIDLKYGLNSLDIFPTSEEINLLLKRFDLKNQGVISYTNFYNMVAPSDREYRRMLEGRIPSEYVYRYNKADVFLPTTKLYLQNLFTLIIRSEAKLEGWRQKLNRMSRFNVRAIFEKFDRIDRGYLSESDIIGYFKLNQINYFVKDIELLVQRLDRDGDGRISYSEFAEELYPKSREYFDI